MTYVVNSSVPSLIFRAYDIRGTIEDLLTPNTVYSIGRALGTLALEKGQKTLLIGRDGRLSGPALSAALAQGLLEAGCDVIDIGEVPTPLLYFAAQVTGTFSGVMLTGSHNPVNYNGLKMLLQGETLAEAAIQSLYQRIVSGKLAEGQGQLTQQDLTTAYIERITGEVRLKRPLKIVIDCGNGIAGKVAPTLFRALGCQVETLYCEVDGHFPNHHPDPSRLENLQDLIETVQDTQADVGLAFDGDGDRLGMVTNTGKVIFPDRQLMLFAQDVLSRNPGATIIYDVKSSRHLAPFIQQYQGNPLLWKTGHALIKNKMRETHALLAGEMSGHFFFKERWYGFDDALYAGARLLEILSSHSESADEIFNALPEDVSTPEINLPMADDVKFQFIEQLIQQTHFPEARKITLDGLRLEFPNGWGLVRCSNTTPCLVLRFEATDNFELERIKSLIKGALQQVNPQLNIPPF